MFVVGGPQLLVRFEFDFQIENYEKIIKHYIDNENKLRIVFFCFAVIRLNLFSAYFFFFFLDLNKSYSHKLKKIQTIRDIHLCF